ncbi:MAG: D-alanine--D-alanine ligase [Bacteroidota bacterium]
MSKIRLALIFGGRSPEHAISIRSARNIFAAIDREKFDVALIGIDPQGRWWHLPYNALQPFTPDEEIWQNAKALALLPGYEGRPLTYLTGAASPPQIDVVFPITHGPFGEDGSLQGILRHLNLPFVGPDVLGSSVSMDKDVAKRLLLQADLQTAAYRCFAYHEKDAVDYMAVVNELGLPLFIKPANMGSSVGVKKVESKDEFDQALAEAFRYDRKVIVEEAIAGRELECAVMGNGILATTAVGEVGMSQGFYTYEAKYVSDDEARVLIPAPGLDDQTMAKLVSVARSAYQALECEGMTRVDMFLTEEGAVYVNELNTLPGFTSISMYPKLWEAAGLSYSDLITELIELAMNRGREQEELRRTLGDFS